MKPIEQLMNEDYEWVVVTDDNLLWVYEHSVSQLSLPKFIESYREIKAYGGRKHVLVRSN